MGFIDDIIEAYGREKSQLVLPELTKQDANYNRNYVKARQEEFYGNLNYHDNWADTSFTLLQSFAHPRYAMKKSDIDAYRRRKDLLAKGLAAGFICKEVLDQDEVKDVLLGNIRSLDREQIAQWYPGVLEVIREIATVNAIIAEKIEAKESARK